MWCGVKTTWNAFVPRNRNCKTSLFRTFVFILVSDGLQPSVACSLVRTERGAAVAPKGTAGQTFLQFIARKIICYQSIIPNCQNLKP